MCEATSWFAKSNHWKEITKEEIIIIRTTNNHKSLLNLTIIQDKEELWNICTSIERRYESFSVLNRIIVYKFISYKIGDTLGDTLNIWYDLSLLRTFRILNYLWCLLLQDLINQKKKRREEKVFIEVFIILLIQFKYGQFYFWSG